MELKAATTSSFFFKGLLKMNFGDDVKYCLNELDSGNLVTESWCDNPDGNASAEPWDPSMDDSGILCDAGGSASAESWDPSECMADSGIPCDAGGFASAESWDPSECMADSEISCDAGGFASAESWDQSGCTADSEIPCDAGDDASGRYRDPSMDGSEPSGDAGGSASAESWDVVGSLSPDHQPGFRDDSELAGDSGAEPRYVGEFGSPNGK